jgi:3-hydroxybutyryl-CoA dehydrogenase
MKIGLIGYGKMGKSIFQLLSSAGQEVTVLVTSPVMADQNNIQLKKRLQRGVRQGLLDENQFALRLATQQFTSRLEDLQDRDLVIESIPEDQERKGRLYRELEKTVSSESIIVSNTSSLSLNVLAQSLDRAERFCGFHFFHPIPLTSVIEIICWDRVSQQTLETLSQLSRSLDRTPLLVKDGPGSVINAVLACECCEALYILEQGLALPTEIDRIAGRFFRIGPCETLDTIGIEFFAGLFERTTIVRPVGVITPHLLFKLVADGRKGKDWGKGIFLYFDQKADNDAAEYYQNPRQNHSLETAERNPEATAKRLLFALLCGALFVLDRGLAPAEAVDLGVKDILAMKEGPITMMKAMGKARLREELNSLATTVGQRFDPALADIL